MAEGRKEVKRGELRRISTNKTENGYNMTCTYEDANPKTTSKRAGWVPISQSNEDYIAKTQAEVIKRLKEVL